MITLDPTTGNHVCCQQHQMLVTWLDDSAYIGLMVVLYHYTGIDRIFVPLPNIFFSNPKIVQALRYGLMFGSMLELRRWLEMYGISTELFSHYFRNLLARIV